MQELLASPAARSDPPIADTGPMEARQLGAFARTLTLPLGDLAYAVDAHLYDNCARLDTDTRILLANLRDHLYRLHREGMDYARVEA